MTEALHTQHALSCAKASKHYFHYRSTIAPKPAAFVLTVIRFRFDFQTALHC